MFSVYPRKRSRSLLRILIDNNVIDGSSWGIYMTTSPDGVISNNIIKNQKTTGLLNFGSARTLITNNTVINASNHGIDVRHGTCPFGGKVVSGSFGMEVILGIH